MASATWHHDRVAVSNNVLLSPVEDEFRVSFLQSEKLIDKYGLIHLSTGNILREEIVTSTDGRREELINQAIDLIPRALGVLVEA